MRTLIFVLLSVLVLFGCQPQSEKQPSSGLLNKQMQVEIDGDGKFPEFLVGIWRSDKDGWEFVFNPDGSLESAVVTLGRVRIRPGETTIIPMKKGGTGKYKPGPWYVGYLQEQKELTIEIVMEDLYIEIDDAVLLGKSRDVFVGEVSENGEEWQVEWMSYPDYIAKVPGKEDFPMREEEGYGVPHQIVFTKELNK